MPWEYQLSKMAWEYQLSESQKQFFYGPSQFSTNEKATREKLRHRNNPPKPVYTGVLIQNRVYTQGEIVARGSKALIYRYKMTEESAKLAREWSNLINSYDGKAKTKIKAAYKEVFENSKYCHLREFLKATNDYSPPTWDRYLYRYDQKNDKEFLINCDRNNPNLKLYENEKRHLVYDLNNGKAIFIKRNYETYKGIYN